MHPFLNINSMVPPQCVQFTHISQFSHGTIRLGRIKNHLALILRFLHYQIGQGSNGDFFACANIDMAVPNILCAFLISIFKIDMFHYVDTGIRHFLTPQKFAKRFTGSPQHDRWSGDTVFHPRLQFHLRPLPVEDSGLYVWLPNQTHSNI